MDAKEVKEILVEALVKTEQALNATMRLWCEKNGEVKTTVGEEQLAAQSARANAAWAFSCIQGAYLALLAGGWAMDGVGG